MTTPGPSKPRRPSLFWRLLPSYLLVIAVAAAVTFVAGEGFAPLLLRRHVNDMMQAMDVQAMEPGMRAMSEDLNAAYRRALTQSLAWAALAAAVAAGAVGFFVTDRIVQPLRAMRRASHGIAGGRYHERLDDDAPGEVGDLAAAFNTMAATLERSEERRVALLADVAHEFRTPLSNLRGYVEGIEDGVFATDDRATLPACRRQIERLERLVDDLSLLSRVETGALPLTMERGDARRWVQSASAAFRPAFRERGVTLEVAVPEGPVWVRADSERCEQAVANLLDNALRHTPQGGTVTLSLATPGADPHGARALVRVSDTGPGISPEDLPNVFKRFYRGNEGPRSDGGSGIGLTIAKHLIERQEGQMGADSPPGSGATFWFSLPLAPPGP